MVDELIDLIKKRKVASLCKRVVQLYTENPKQILKHFIVLYAKLDNGCNHHLSRTIATRVSRFHKSDFQSKEIVDMFLLLYFNCKREYIVDEDIMKLCKKDRDRWIRRAVSRGAYFGSRRGQHVEHVGVELSVGRWPVKNDMTCASDPETVVKVVALCVEHDALASMKEHAPVPRLVSRLCVLAAQRRVETVTDEQISQTQKIKIRWDKDNSALLRLAGEHVLLIGI